MISLCVPYVCDTYVTYKCDTCATYICDTFVIHICATCIKMLSCIHKEYMWLREQCNVVDEISYLTPLEFSPFQHPGNDTLKSWFLIISNPWWCDGNNYKSLFLWFFHYDVSKGHCFQSVWFRMCEDSLCIVKWRSIFFIFWYKFESVYYWRNKKIKFCICKLISRTCSYPCAK